LQTVRTGPVRPGAQPGPGLRLGMPAGERLHRGWPGYGVAAGTGLSGPAKAELSLQMFWLPLMPW